MTPRCSDITMSDYYCGAGGSTTGGILVPGVRVIMAVNHWDLAIATHNTNHPDTDHDKADINKADPHRYPRTNIGWFSRSAPTGHRRAARSSPPTGSSPGTSSATLSRTRPPTGPGWACGTCPASPPCTCTTSSSSRTCPRVVKGVHWNRWLTSMHDMGYKHEVIWLNSMHSQGLGDGAPQSRDRVYIVFWRAGNLRPRLRTVDPPRGVLPRARPHPVRPGDEAPAAQSRRPMGRSTRCAARTRPAISRCSRPSPAPTPSSTGPTAAPASATGPPSA